MKKIIGLIGVGVIAVIAMSSTCSNDGKAVASENNALEAAVPAGPGIEFKKMTFEKAKAEAKKSGKLIFIDAYTDWCGPCKRMSATSFKDKEVGDLFNKNFINLKIEMEKDPEGPEVARRYGVKAYPTLIIVDGTGRMVKQSIGMKNKDQLMAFAKSAL